MKINKSLLIFFITISFGQANSNQEIQLGFLKHDIKSGLSHACEPGYSLHLNYLHPSPTWLEKIFAPRPMIGAHIHTGGKTSQAFAGLQWRLFDSSPVFLDLMLGAAIHNGNLKHKRPQKKAYGSRVLFHEAVAIGVKISESYRVSAYLGHSSNCRIAKPNPGLTNCGIVLGWQL